MLGNLEKLAKLGRSKKNSRARGVFLQMRDLEDVSQP